MKKPVKSFGVEVNGALKPVAFISKVSAQSYADKFKNKSVRVLEVSINSNIGTTPSTVVRFICARLVGALKKEVEKIEQEMEDLTPL